MVALRVDFKVVGQPKAAVSGDYYTVTLSLYL